LDAGNDDDEQIGHHLDRIREIALDTAEDGGKNRARAFRQLFGTGLARADTDVVQPVLDVHAAQLLLDALDRLLQAAAQRRCLARDTKAAEGENAADARNDD